MGKLIGYARVSTGVQDLQSDFRLAGSEEGKRSIGKPRLRCKAGVSAPPSQVPGSGP